MRTEGNYASKKQAHTVRGEGVSDIHLMAGSPEVSFSFSHPVGIQTPFSYFVALLYPLLRFPPVVCSEKTR
jgi:hypothetical protein